MSNIQNKMKGMTGNKARKKVEKSRSADKFNRKSKHATRHLAGGKRGGLRRMETRNDPCTQFDFSSAEHFSKVGDDLEIVINATYRATKNSEKNLHESLVRRTYKLLNLIFDLFMMQK